MTPKPHSRVWVAGVGAGTVIEQRGAYVFVRLDGRTAPYLARPENLTPMRNEDKP